MKTRNKICLTVFVAALLVGATAIDTIAQRGRYDYNNDVSVTNLSVTNITDVTEIQTTNVTNVTQIVMNDTGDIGLGTGKGRIKFKEDTIDVVSVKTGILRLQLQADGFAIVNDTSLGVIDFYGDDDTADADEIGGQIEVKATGTWTDGAEDTKMVLQASNNGTLNANQLVLNTDGTVDIGTNEILTEASSSTSMADTSDLLYETELDDLSELTAQIGDVTAFVVESTACSDLEGTGLSIAAGTLNWAAASTDLSDTAALLYETELDDLSELTAQMADVTAFVTDDIMPAAGTDPDVDAVGEFSIDTDGANEPNDVVLRSIDGGNTPLQIALAQQQKIFQATIIKPNDLADATRDACPIWSNETGMSFVVTKIEAWSDTDDTEVNVEEEDADGANNTTVDAVNIQTDGTGVYYHTETTITAATIEANHILLLDFDDTDDPGWVKVSICGYFLANVD